MIPPQPVEAEVVHQFGELLEVERFHQIAIGVIFIGPADVAFRVRRREDDDRNRLELVDAANDFEDFDPVDPLSRGLHPPRPCRVPF